MSTSIHRLDLAPYGITLENVHRNLSHAVLYEHAIRYEPRSSIADSGALCAYSGAKTGRSPPKGNFLSGTRCPWPWLRTR